MGDCLAGWLFIGKGLWLPTTPSLWLPEWALSPRGKAAVPHGGWGRGGRSHPPRLCSRRARQRFSMGCVLTAAWVPPWPRSSAGSY